MANRLRAFGRRKGNHHLMRNLKLITASVLAILVAILVVQNREPVTTHLLFATAVMPHAILLFINAAVGFALGVLLTMSLNASSGSSLSSKASMSL